MAFIWPVFLTNARTSSDMKIAYLSLIMLLLSKNKQIKKWTRQRRSGHSLFLCFEWHNLYARNFWMDIVFFQIQQLWKRKLLTAVEFALKSVAKTFGYEFCPPTFVNQINAIFASKNWRAFFERKSVIILIKNRLPTFVSANYAIVSANVLALIVRPLITSVAHLNKNSASVPNLCANNFPHFMLIYSVF